MKFKKLTSIITSVLLISSMCSSSVLGAEKNNVTSNKSVLSENVLQVNIDEDGNLTYAEPETSLEDSVFSWDNATVYFALTDRFNNGDTSNDHSYGRSLNEDGSVQSGYKENPGTFHGGDLKGLIEKLNDGYFTDLGVNAIWITAPYEQIHGYTFGNTNNEEEGYGFPYYGYHGYWALDYTNVDENMGTAKDMEKFVDTAHSKGIRVVMDVVMNHLGYISAYDTNEFGFGKTISNWKDYYYGNLSNLRGGDWEEANIYENDSSWASKWYGGDFVRIAYPFDGYTGSKYGDDQTRCLYGLPDIKMESKTEVSTPPFLVNKWKKEGRYDEEIVKQNAFFKKTGLPKTPQNYVVQWLTDWVREYGIDGFRCDTAKHIPVSSWNELKTQAKAALKEWRENNPDKPGANWDEEFWMTGEDWGHGVGKDYYFSNGFDSMINFTFPKSGYSTSTLEGTYSTYAKAINSDSTFNVLSYISSHDTDLGGRGDLISAGTALLLTPGAAQIFYGDETGRQKQWESFCANNYTDQVTRSDMNWNSIDKNVLSHWQKVGQFRNKHLSIGAGQHKMLSSSPYTFSRTYQGEDGVVDNVICVVGANGSTTVDVSSVFDDGDTITDFYTGNKTVVTDGKVTFTAGTNGVMLLESNSKKPAVSANPAGGDYYKEVSEGLEVKLTVGNVDTATYSINGGEEVSYKNGDKIVIGEGEEFGTKTTVTIKASNNDGSVEKTYTYNKRDPKEKFVKLHFKNNGWINPNVYIYKNDETGVTQLTGTWPGEAMTAETGENQGWYSYEVQGELGVNVIFNSGSMQVPGSGQEGFEASYEMWYVDGILTNVCPEDYTKEDDDTLSVKANPNGGSYKAALEEGLQIELSAKNAEKATYSIDGAKEVEYKNGDKITIGKGAEFGKETVLVLTAVNGEEKVTKTLTYKKEEPITEFVKVHFKKDRWTNPNVYIYTGDGNSAVKLTGDWPGKAMTAEADENKGWYSYEVKDVSAAKVIFNYGSQQIPGSGQAGLDASYEMWYVDGKLTAECPKDYIREGEVRISSSVESGEYAAETEEGLEVKLSSKNAEVSKYSIDGSEAVEYKDGDTIVIGKGKEAGTVTTLVLTAVNGEETVTKTYSYKKTEPVEEFIEVHFKKDGWKNPRVYIYKEDSNGVVEYVGKWPGAEMLAEGNDNEGWYTFRMEGIANAKVIFSSGSMQTPSSGAAGYDVSGEMWYVDGKLVSTVPSDYKN